MKWTRERPGVYTAGPYTVEHHADGFWLATGPNLPDHEKGAQSLKTDAQYACKQACARRLLGEGQVECEPVIGDIVVTLADKRRGQITMMLKPGATNPVTLWCIKFARGRRLCLLRHEFEVVMP